MLGSRSDMVSALPPSPRASVSCADGSLALCTSALLPPKSLCRSRPSVFLQLLRYPHPAGSLSSRKPIPPASFPRPPLGPAAFELRALTAFAPPFAPQVLQPYKKNNTKTVSTVLQRLTLQDNTKAADDVKVMKQRQRSAFPPNYIHSIDSTHMMMTAIECRKRGLAFAGVHDSFWTHAGTIETMNQVLREKFLELHSKPLLQMLLVQLQEQYPGVEFDEVPMHGDLKLEEIRRAKYFFS